MSISSNIDQFEKDLKKKGEEKFIKQTTELYKTFILTAFQFITANSLLVGTAYGSPVLTGRFYSSHTVQIGSIDKTVKPVNPAGKEKPYSSVPQAQAAARIANVKLSDVVYIANSLDYARFLEDGGSKFKAPNGIYKVAAQLVKVKYKNVTVS